jgi:hypothetical protein
MIGTKSLAVAKLFDGQGQGRGSDGDGRRDPRLLLRLDRPLQDPRYIRFVDAFPMTVTGNVRKFLMREQSVKDLGLQKAAAMKMA